MIEENFELIKWFSELDKHSGSVAGGKGANLAEIYNLGINVPAGFVVTAQAYNFFIEKAGLKEKIKEILDSIDYEDTAELNKKTEQIRGLIVHADFPKNLKQEILEAYEYLDTGTLGETRGTILEILKNSEPIFVAVRSSATTEDLAEASFAGQQDTYLNVKGNTNLLNSIKKCFASLFTSRATYYRNKKNFNHLNASLAVVVQKMVDSDKSGVIFSKDPTNRSKNIIMEAVFGLGEGIVSGKITPDKYVVSPEFEILEKNISNKKIAITRDSSGKHEEVRLVEEKSKQQVLREFEIKKLAEIALKLEEHYQKPQDIEFAIEGEETYIVQTRPVTTIGKKVESKEIKGDVILSGLGASPGVAVGTVKVIKDLADLDKIKQGDVLVTGMTNPDMVVTMQKSAAIITDEGGMTAHAAIVSREMGIPCVVGTREATMKLKDGDVVTVDGSSGNIYSGKVAETQKKEILPVTTKTKTKLKVIVDLPTFAERASKTGIKNVGLTRLEGIIAESGKHPNYFLKNKQMKEYEDIIFNGLSKIADFFEEIWVRTSDIRSDEFQNLEGAPKKEEANPMLGMHGIRYGLKNPEVILAELNALKRVAEKGKKIGVLSPQVISVEEVQELKKYIEQIQFNDVKLGIMIETPAAVQLIKELCNGGIQFISFGTNDLTQYILAVDRGNQQVQHLYNEMHPAILHQLEFVIRVCKRAGVETSICGQAGSKKEMVRFLVEKGIDSISVNADIAKEISDYISEIEKELGEEPRQYEPSKELENIEPTPTESPNETKPAPSETVPEEEKIEESLPEETPNQEEVSEPIQEESSEDVKEEIQEAPQEENFNKENLDEQTQEVQEQPIVKEETPKQDNETFYKEEVNPYNPDSDNEEVLKQEDESANENSEEEKSENKFFNIF